MVSGVGDRVTKIAVVRANGIGDYVFAVPALAALRARFPDAEIVLLGQPWHRAFLKGRPGPVDRAVAIPPCIGVGVDPGGEEEPAALDDFFAAMRAERFDIAVQMHGGGRYSNPFTRRLGARLTVGLQAPDAVALDRNVPYLYFQPEILRYLEVVALLGARPPFLEPRIAVTRGDEAELAAVPLQADQPLAVLHPGASDPRRWWPAEKFAEVGDHLCQAGAQVAVIGAPPEAELAASVVERMHHFAVNLAGLLSLGGTAALLSRSAVFVGNDSGPLHLAGAAGAATVGIFWCGNLINGGPPTRTRHRPAVSWRLHCPVCRRNTLEANCEHRASFVADIPVEEVTASALSLFSASRTPGA